MERKLGLGLTDISVEMLIREERARGESGLEKRISASSAGAWGAVRGAGAQREMWQLSPWACQCLVSYVSCLLDSCIKYLLID